MSRIISLSKATRLKDHINSTTFTVSPTFHCCSIVNICITKFLCGLSYNTRLCSLHLWDLSSSVPLFQPFLILVVRAQKPSTIKKQPLFILALLSDRSNWLPIISCTFLVQARQKMLGAILRHGPPKNMSEPNTPSVVLCVVDNSTAV